MNVGLRDLSSKEFPIGTLPIVLARPHPDIQIVVTKPRIGFTPGMPAIGRPAVLLRRLHHARRHRVQFYVAHSGKEIFVRLHETRLMASFPQRTGTPVLAVDVQNIMAPEVLQAAKYPRCRAASSADARDWSSARRRATPRRIDLDLREGSPESHGTRLRRKSTHPGCFRAVPHAPGYRADTHPCFARHGTSFSVQLEASC